MKRSLLLFKGALVLSGVLGCPLVADAQLFQWGNHLGGQGVLAYTNAVTTDKEGNSFIAGYYSGGKISFNDANNKVLDPVGSQDAFLAKYDPTGKLLWANKIAGPGLENANSVAVDSKGDVYITGDFEQTAYFNNGANPLTVKGKNDIYLAKYTNDGSYLWAKHIGGDDADYGSNVKVDKNDNVYITGSFSNVADFNIGGTAKTLSSSGFSDIFLAKYDKDGNNIWARGMGSNAYDGGYGVAVDTANNVYLTGQFQNIVDFNPGGNAQVLTAVGGYDAFIAKYDTDGDCKWAIKIGSSGTEFGYSVAVDNEGNVYNSGRFQQTVNMDFRTGPVNYTVSGLVDAYLAKYDKDGNYKWSKALGGTGSTEYGLCVALDPAANIYISGVFQSMTNFNPNGNPAVNITPTAGMDAFLAKYDKDGNYKWAGKVGGVGFEWGRGVAVDNSGNIFLAGNFSQTADFDPGVDSFKVTANGSTDGFLVKLLCTDTVSSSITDSVCNGLYSLNGIEYTESGNYTQVYHATSGCDSTLYLNLTIYNLEEPVIRVNGFVLSVDGNFKTYQWLKNGSPIEGATSNTLTVSENADYQVVITNEEGCSATSPVYKVENVSLKDIAGIGNTIRLYPNPARERVYIDSPVPLSLKLYSIEGRTIWSRRNGNSVSISQLAEGVYLLQISDLAGRLIKVEKIVKQ